MNTPRNVIAIAGVAASIGLGASVVAAESLFGTPIPFDTPPFNYNEGPPPSGEIFSFLVWHSMQRLAVG